jgi:predicted phage terminase large subunit-like protein
MGSVLSRFDNPNKGVFLNIGQRLHIEDPSGALIKMPGFKLLKIATIAQDDEEHPIVDGHYEVPRGGILQESLADEKTLATLRNAMGEAAFAAQYLQEPIPEGGGLLTFSSFVRLAEQPQGVIHLSVDTGQTKGGGDYSVIMAIGYEDESFHILDIYRGQVNFEGLNIALLHKINVYKPAGILIETTGGYGGALLEVLRNTHGVQNLHPFKSSLSKEQRFYKAWPIIEGSDVTLPETALWLPEFRKEFVSFPAGKHDDQLDALSQFLMRADWLLKRAGCDPPEKYSPNLVRLPS